MLTQHRIDMQGDIFCEQRRIVTNYGFLEVPRINAATGDTRRLSENRLIYCGRTCQAGFSDPFR